MKKSICVLLTLCVLLCAVSGCGQKLPLEIIGENSISDSSAYADRAETVRVVQYNSKNCDNGKKIQEIAEEIQREAPQIVCLQELDWDAKRSGGQELAKLLAEHLSMNYLFIPSIPFEGGLYGIAILSVYPLENSTRTELSVQKGEEARVLAKTTVDIHGKTVEILNTHLSFESKASRQAQFGVLRENTESAERFILCGDFNVESYAEFEALGAVQTVNNEVSNYSTYVPTAEESDLFLGLDNIVVSENLKIQNSRMVKTSVSDHNMLVADIIL